MLLLASLALAASASVTPLPSPQDTLGLAVVDLSQSKTLTVEDLLALDLDVASHTVRDGRVELVVDAADRELLRTRGIAFELLQEDLTAYLAARLDRQASLGAGGLGSFLNPPFAQGAMGGYYSFGEIESVLDQIAAAFPAITTDKFSIGTTGQGRTLWAIKVSDNPDLDENEPEVRFDAMHHAREPQSMMTTLWTLLYLVENYGTDPFATYLVDNREMWFLPCVNPDGYEYNRQIAPNGGGLWRKNRRNNGGGQFGVDLNRNYSYQWGPSAGSSSSPSSDTYRGPSAASEPEVAAMEAFISSRNFVTALSSHSYSDLWLFPWGYVASGPSNEAEYDEISALQTAFNNYPFGPAAVILYLANGVTVDYDHGVHGTLSWTPEIGSLSDNFWPPTSRIIPLAQENEQAFLRTAQAAGAYLNVNAVTRSEVGDGDGLFEAGESVEWRYDLRNSGKGAPLTDVILTLSTSSSFATVDVASVNLGSVGSFSNADNNATPLSLSIAAGTPPGTAIAYTTSIDYEGYSEVTGGTLLVGAPRALILDEVEVDLGWTIGTPSDDASTGLWEWGSPLGTSSGGDPINPGADNTPAPGVNCFTTGNGSSSAGGDDIDNGTTTLISPQLHVADLGSVVVNYARWYALTGNNPDDQATIDVSNDDGATWVNVETIASHENFWQEKSFVLTDFLSPTDEVRLRFQASDLGSGSLVEAALDDLAVETFDGSPRVAVYGRPQIGSEVAVNLTADPGGTYTILYSFAPAAIDLAGVVGTILIDPTQAIAIVSGVVPDNGGVNTQVTIPNDNSLVGLSLWFQGLRLGNGIEMSNDDVIVFE